MTSVSRIKNEQTDLIMLVEDDRIQAMLLRAILSAQGYKVVCAEDGLEALGILQRGTIPNLLITDLNMPKIDGFELLTELRIMKLQIPIMITSGVCANNTFEKAFTLGARGFLPKPFSELKTTKAIKDILRRTTN